MCTEMCTDVRTEVYTEMHTEMCKGGALSCTRRMIQVSSSTSTRSSPPPMNTQSQVHHSTLAHPAVVSLRQQVATVETAVPAYERHLPEKVRAAVRNYREAKSALFQLNGLRP